MPLSRINNNAIANNTIVAADLAAGSVTGDKLGATAINANNIVNGTITTTQIASNTISNTNIQTGAIENYSRATGLLSGMRNRIINGAMVIDQRNGGASLTQSTSDQFVVDRMRIFGSAASKFTAQRSTTAPAGFINSVICTSSSAYTVGSSEAFIFGQQIEGLNVADLGWGTANAKTVTLSFWVRSSLTGTFGGSLRNSGGTRSYPFSYTISAANTFEQKSITITGDTSGTWLTDTGIGINLVFSLGSGSTFSGTAGAWAGSNFTSATGATSVVGTNGATFYITGVQLEVGSTATSFDYRQHGTELALCQRYFEVCDMPYIYMGGASFTDLYWYMPFKVTKRGTPTVTSTTTLQYFSGGAGTNFSPTLSGSVNQIFIAGTGLTTASGFTGQQGVLRASIEL